MSPHAVRDKFLLLITHVLIAADLFPIQMTACSDLTLDVIATAINRFPVWHGCCARRAYRDEVALVPNPKLNHKGGSLCLALAHGGIRYVAII